MKPGPASARRPTARFGAYIAGGVAWLLPLRPQQAMLPSVFTPQVW